MSNLVIPRREIWTQQPQGPVELDQNNPITEGLVSVQFGDFVYDLASRQFAIRSGVTVTASKLGKVARLNGSAYINRGQSVGGVNLFASAGNPWSVVICARQSVAGSTGTFVAKAVADNASRNFQLFKTSGSETPSFNIRGTGTDTNWGFDDTNFHQYTAAWDGSTLLAYGDDSKQSTIPVGTAALDAENIIYGARTGGTGALLTGEIAYVFIFNRPISKSESDSLFANPWQIFAPQSRQLFVPVSVGGTTTVTSDSTAAYKVQGSIQASSVAAYGIRSAIQSDSAVSYAIRASAQNNAASAYSIRGATQQSSALAYAIRGLVDQAVAVNYSIRSAVSSDASATYNILSASSVSASTSAGYNIRGLVQQSIAASYAIDGGTFTGSISDEDIARIVQAVLAALNATTIPVDTRKMNGAPIIGTGLIGDDWRGVGVQPQ